MKIEDRILEAEKYYAKFMDVLGIPIDDNSRDTAHRVAKMMVTERCKSLYEDPPELAFFPKDGYDEYVVVKDIPYYSVCFLGSTFLRTDKGHKRIADIQKGDKVATLKDGLVVWTTVEDKGKRKVESLLQIKTKKTYIKVTEEHPIFTKKGWVRAGDLMIGDSVAYVNNRWFTGLFERAKVEPSYNLGYMLGCILSDGYVSGREVGMKVTEKWFAEKFAESIYEVFGRKVKAKGCQGYSSFRKSNIDMYAVRVVSRHISKIVNQLTQDKNKCKTHRVPEVVKTSRVCMQGFLDGYIDGDGCKSGNSGGNCIITANKEFAEELSELVGSSKFSERMEKFGPVYTLYISANWELPLYGRKGFIPTSYDFQQQDFEWDPVEEISMLNRSGKKMYEVYNISCSPYDTYLANGILAHNCAHHHVSFSGQAHIAYHPKDKVVGISKLARVVNYFASKPQIQELMTSEIIDYLYKGLQPNGVMVRVEGVHLCMTGRGAKAIGSKTITQAIRGNIDKREVEQLFKD